MINSELGDPRLAASQDEATHMIVLSGARGAVVLAGIGALIVMLLWFGFYMLVFLPRGAP